MADRRGADKKDEGPARRVRRQTEGPETEQEPEKEDKLPEQSKFGNSFLLGAMSQRNDGAPADAGGVDQEAAQEYGGVEDADEAPPQDDDADDHWFRPRFRRKGGEEVERIGGDEAAEPGIPAEDTAWIEALTATGSPWSDPAPQPLDVVLDGALGGWLRALLPVAGPLPSQIAVVTGVCGDPRIQDPSGSPLIGVACAATLGAAVARLAVDSPMGRIRVNRGLALASAPEAPRDAARTAGSLANLGPPTALPSNPPDPWLARLTLARLALDQPAVPTLDDPPPKPVEADAVLDYNALLVAEIGAGPDPAEAVRSAALESCEAQAVWAVALRRGIASGAVVLGRTGCDPGVLSAVLYRSDELVGQAISLLQEIAAATRGGRVPIKGLRNGLARSGRILLTAHRAAVEGLAAAGAVPIDAVPRPEPTHLGLVQAVQEGRPVPELEAEAHPDLIDLRIAIEGLRAKDADALSQAGRAIRARAAEQQSGVGVATGALFEMEALSLRSQDVAAAAHRDDVGAMLLGAGARSGLSLLARWRPIDRQAG